MATEWTEEKIEELRKLWAQNVPTAEIGRRLSVTKNAVIGKAHREKLPKRISPIKSKKKEGKISSKVTKIATKSSPKKTVSDKKKPLVQSVDNDDQSSKKIINEKKDKKASSKVAKKEKSSEKKAISKKVDIKNEASPKKVKKKDKKPQKNSVEAPKRTCQWPEGDPGSIVFYFCGQQPVLPGKPYCKEHAEIAYPKLKLHKK